MDDFYNHTLRLSATDTLPFLQSISRNDSLEAIVLVNMRLSGTATGAFTQVRSARVKLHKCQMGPNDAMQIAEALETNENIQYLSLTPTFTDTDMLPVAQRLAFNRHLRKIRLDMEDANEDNAEAVAAYLQAFARFQIVTLIEDIRNEASFRALIRIIPQLRTRRLRIKFQLDLTVEDRMPRFVEALEHNYNIRQVEATMEDEGGTVHNVLLPGTAESVQLRRCLDRNSRLAAWVDNPSLVPKELWTQALILARAAGKESLWQSLLLVAPEMASGRRKRKRERPDSATFPLESNAIDKHDLSLPRQT